MASSARRLLRRLVDFWWSKSKVFSPERVGDLDGGVACEPSNATVVIDKLESQRLIERRPHPTDRRAKQLALTPEGAGLRERLLELLTEEPLLTGLTQQEQDSSRNCCSEPSPAAEIPQPVILRFAVDRSRNGRV